LIEGEGVIPTSHDKIRVLAPATINSDTVINELDVLYAAARTDNIAEIVSSLKRLVPDFKPSAQLTGEAPLPLQRLPLGHSSGDPRKVVQLPRRG